MLSKFKFKNTALDEKSYLIEIVMSTQQGHYSETKKTLIKALVTRYST